MSGVWIFRDGVAKLVQNPLVESFDEVMEVITNEVGGMGGGGCGGGHNRSKRKALVYLPTNQIVSSYCDLEQKLYKVGWVRYPNEDPNLVQYHKDYSSLLLLSLPRDPRKFRTMHMYDIVLKNRDCFQVRDLYI